MPSCIKAMNRESLSSTSLLASFVWCLNVLFDFQSIFPPLCRWIPLSSSDPYPSSPRHAIIPIAHSKKMQKVQKSPFPDILLEIPKTRSYHIPYTSLAERSGVPHAGGEVVFFVDEQNPPSPRRKPLLIVRRLPFQSGHLPQPRHTTQLDGVSPLQMRPFRLLHVSRRRLPGLVQALFSPNPPPLLVQPQPGPAMPGPTPHIFREHSLLHSTQLVRRFPPPPGEGPVDYEHGDDEDGEEEEIVV